MLDVVTLGEAMTLFVPARIGRLRYANHYERSVAGAESNTAIGLAKLGHRVGWLSRVGDDEFGQYILSFLRGEQVDVSRVRLTPDAPTGVFFKERRSLDATRVFYYRAGSAASRLHPHDLDADYLRSARYLHLTGITPALSASCRETTKAAIQIANEAGVPISFDPNLRLKLWSAGEAREAFLEILPHVQLVLTSLDEAALITGLSDPERAAARLLDTGPSTVVIKRGEEGATAADAEGILFAPAMKVSVVETVGAGDAFNAGFLSGRLRGWSLAESLRLGNIMGALATTAPGDIEGLPDWAEVQAYLGGDAPVAR
ncbi:MAG: sugar kinase [Rhodothermales bacterium]